MNNPKTRQAWILDELKKSPTIGFTDVLTGYLLKFTKSKVTFSKDWKQATSKFEEYQKKVNQVKEDISIKQDVKAFKEGLKTKNERLLTLQKLVDDCFIDLAEGKTDGEYYKGGKPVAYRRKMTNTEYNQTRRTLKDLQAEISKIEGDYAPAKTEHSGTITAFGSEKQEKDFNEFLKKKYNFK